MSMLLKKRALGAVVLGAALVGAVACSASNAPIGSRPGPGQASGGSGSSGNAPGTPGTAASGNIDINPSNGGAPAGDGGCQHVEVNFVPKIPSIFVLVDRSDSMFTPDSKQVVSWAPLKAGVLAVIKQLGGQVRFGFGAFTGQQAQGAVAAKCPIFESIAPALNN